MSDDIKLDQEESKKSLEDNPVESRRKFTKAGLAGSAVLMSLVNRPALATNGNECTASILMSGNLSAHPDQVDCDFGCSPGFWKQDGRTRPATQAWNEIIEINSGDNFATAFNLATADYDDEYTEYLKTHTLGEVINAVDLPNSLNPLKSVGLHAVAALANSYHPLIRLTYVEPSIVIAAFQNAYASYAACMAVPIGDVPGTVQDCMNTMGGLKDFVGTYDLYAEPNGQACPLGNDPWQPSPW